MKTEYPLINNINKPSGILTNKGSKSKIWTKGTLFQPNTKPHTIAYKIYENISTGNHKSTRHTSTKKIHPATFYSLPISSYLLPLRQSRLQRRIRPPTSMTSSGANSPDSRLIASLVASSYPLWNKEISNLNNNNNNTYPITSIKIGRIPEIVKWIVPNLGVIHITPRQITILQIKN